MNIFEKILFFLQGEMKTPVPYGWFHIMWILISLGYVFILFLLKNKNREKLLKFVLASYGIIAFLLELIKQLIWSFNYDPDLLLVTWDYQWYSSAFQLCTTPIYVSLICLFLKDGKIRNSLLSYLAYYTILGSIVSMLIPSSLFVPMIEINIHTMFLHGISLSISIYLLLNNVVKIKWKNLFSGYVIFLIFVAIALILDIVVYNINVLNGETFNMFFISPYFPCTLPVLSDIYVAVPYIFFLLIYLLLVLAGGILVFSIAKGINIIHKKIKHH